jgi:hypothetical protein
METLPKNMSGSCPCITGKKNPPARGAAGRGGEDQESAYSASSVVAGIVDAGVDSAALLATAN